jgi:hypothetical protein
MKVGAAMIIEEKKNMEKIAVIKKRIEPKKTFFQAVIVIIIKIKLGIK